MMEMEAHNHMESLSYYGVLGVRMNSSVEEIRRAYRKLAMVTISFLCFLFFFFFFFFFFAFWFNWVCKLILVFRGFCLMGVFEY